MKMQEYQQLAARTLIPRPNETIPDEDIMFIWNAVGLSGETGEVLELLKKAVFHRHPLDREKLTKELGDVLWYLSAIATHAGIDLGVVAEQNIDKLMARYPRGFRETDSINRKD